jgi:hypothetical protein
MCAYRNHRPWSAARLAIFTPHNKIIYSLLGVFLFKKELRLYKRNYVRGLLVQIQAVGTIMQYAPYNSTKGRIVK